MNAKEEYDRIGTAIRSTEDMLRDLCESQRVTIAALVYERDQMRATLETVARKLIEDSEDRRVALHKIREDAGELQTVYTRTVKQRDGIADALRVLVGVCVCVLDENGWTGNNAEFQRTVTRCQELLTLIDQSKAADRAKQEG